MNQDKLSKNTDKSFTLTTSIPTASVQKIYQDTLKKLGEKTKIKGFRPGKAPLEKIEKTLDPQKLLEETANILISQVWSEKIKEHELKPVIIPKTRLLNPPLAKDKIWQLEFTACEEPEIDLGNVEEKIKSQNNQDKIWTPEKKETDSPSDSQKQEKIDNIIKAILETVKTTLPQILLDQELDRKLATLVDQVQQAGLTVSRYLETKKTTLEEYKKTLIKQITDNWCLTLSLEKLAEKYQIIVLPEDIEKIQKDSPQTNSYVLSQVLRQQKTLEKLVSI